ncbi:hypothetical protein U1Q18_009786 [Sarracenia purpurea var. burkii]
MVIDWLAYHRGFRYEEITDWLTSSSETKTKQTKKGKKDSGRAVTDPKSSPTDQTLVRDDPKKGDGESSNRCVKSLESEPGGPTEVFLGASSPYPLTQVSVVSSSEKGAEVVKSGKLKGGPGEVVSEVETEFEYDEDEDVEGSCDDHQTEDEEDLRKGDSVENRAEEGSEISGSAINVSTQNGDKLESVEGRDLAPYPAISSEFFFG